MRYQEILEAAANLPDKYMVDPDTDLALNAHGQWTQSPYLGAVKSPKGNGYLAQIHIPQAVWVSMVQQNPHKWSGHAPETFFNEVGNQRNSMRVPFADPRQAAYFMQEVLYGGNIKPQEIIEDFFEEQYLGGDGQLWKSIKAQVPTFEGAPLGSDDETAFFANPEEFKKRRDAAAAQRTVAKNTSEYDKIMPAKIKKALLDFYSKNWKLAAKRFGRTFKPGELEQAVNDIVDEKGIGYFITGPKSINLKDIASLPLVA